MKQSRTVLLYLLLATPLSFIGIASTDVVTMEGIVADGARHMERTHAYAVPYLHNEIYSYKPPLANWLAAGSFRVFGVESEWTLRFPFAGAAVCLGLSVLLATSAPLGGRIALLSAFASLTGGVILRKLHLAEWDILLAAALGVAISAACRNLAEPQPRAALWWVCYFGLGLGFLAKGTPALMFFVPGLVLAAVFTGRLKELGRPRHLVAVGVFVGMASAWIFAAYAQTGWAAFEQPLAEARDKGLSWNLETIATTLAKPFELCILFLPWSLLIPWSVGGTWTNDRGRQIALASISFITAGAAIFMLVPATEQRYLLPLAAPFGLLAGAVASSAPQANYIKPRVVAGFAAATATVAILGLVGVSAGWWSADPTFRTGKRLVVLGVAAALLVASARSMRNRVAAIPVGLMLGAAFLNWFVNVAVIEPRRAAKRSLRPVAEVFEKHLDSVEELWTGPVSKHFHSSSLFFYLGLPVKTVTKGGDVPAKGDYLVLFDNEHADLIDNPPFALELVEQQPHRKLQVLLARVAESP